MKIRPVATELFHAGGQTARHDEANSRFSQFCERAYKVYTWPYSALLERVPTTQQWPSRSTNHLTAICFKEHQALTSLLKCVPTTQQGP